MERVFLTFIYRDFNDQSVKVQKCGLREMNEVIGKIQKDPQKSIVQVLMDVSDGKTIYLKPVTAAREHA